MQWLLLLMMLGGIVQSFREEKPEYLLFVGILGVVAYLIHLSRKREVEEHAKTVATELHNLAKAEVDSVVPVPVPVPIPVPVPVPVPAQADIRDWGARVMDGGTLLVHDAFSSVGVTGGIGRHLVAGRRFRYVGRTGSLAEYCADLRGSGVGRLRNAARQLAESAWFARNLGLKVALTIGYGRLAARLGREVPEWPY